MWAFAVPATAQQALRGRVVDANGDPLTGVSVAVKGTSTGAVTDMDGNYTLAPQMGQTVSSSRSSASRTASLFSTAHPLT